MVTFPFNEENWDEPTHVNQTSHTAHLTSLTWSNTTSTAGGARRESALADNIVREGRSFQRNAASQSRRRRRRADPDNPRRQLTVDDYESLHGPSRRPPPSPEPGAPLRSNPEGREGPVVDSERRLPMRLTGMIFGGLREIATVVGLDPPPYTCFNCWSEDHYVRDCPAPSRWSYCRNCGRRDTDIENCPRCGDANSRRLREQALASSPSLQRRENLSAARGSTSGPRIENGRSTAVTLRPMPPTSYQNNAQITASVGASHFLPPHSLPPPTHQMSNRRVISTGTPHILPPLTRRANAQVTALTGHYSSSLLPNREEPRESTERQELLSRWNTASIRERSPRSNPTPDLRAVLEVNRSNRLPFNNRRNNSVFGPTSDVDMLQRERERDVRGHRREIDEPMPRRDRLNSVLRLLDRLENVPYSTFLNVLDGAFAAATESER